MANYVETFVHPESPKTFLEEAKTKLTLLTCLRVFIEKKLFEFDSKRPEDARCLKSHELFYNKLRDVNGATAPSIKEIYPNWDFKKLKELKTLLNDAEHPYGLIHPVHFAMSLCWDEILQELEIIKAMFLSPSP